MLGYKKNLVQTYILKDDNHVLGSDAFPFGVQVQDAACQMVCDEIPDCSLSGGEEDFARINVCTSNMKWFQL